MRHYLCLVFIGISVVLSAQTRTPDHFMLKGKFPGGDGTQLKLQYSNKEAKNVVDSVIVKNGVFQFEGEIKGPTYAFITGKAKSRSVDDPNFTGLFLEPGTMTIGLEEGKFKQALVTGSKTQTDYAVLQSRLLKVRDRWKIVMDTLSAVNKRSNMAYQEMREWVLAPYFAETREIEMNFFDTHRDSYATAYYLRFAMRDLSTDSLKLFYNRFPEKIKESDFGRYVQAEISKRKVGIPGTMASIFSTVDIKGAKFSLADYKGKYVLLDFWASWCVPCRKGNPHLKELYAKYNSKGLEVIGISDDDRDNAAWKKAVAQDDLPWKHVLRGLKQANGGFDRSADISDRYNVSSLPTQILIDPSGKIIARYGEGAEDHAMLDAKLESLIKL